VKELLEDESTTDDSKPSGDDKAVCSLAAPLGCRDDTKNGKARDEELRFADLTKSTKKHRPS
jgi:hypothetical protein